jgi:hypothetical protein
MQEFLSDTVALSRIQFALTAIFHMLWPVLTTGSKFSKSAGRQAIAQQLGCLTA